MKPSKSFVKKVCGKQEIAFRLFCYIVKRRFVRTPPFGGLSQGTLNPLHMMGLPNRALEPISRSWSFCANTVRSDPGGHWQ
jgi:hypothetical protein